MDPFRQHNSRLRWRCRRGTRELDIMLIRYVEQRCDSWSSTDRTRFEQFLKTQDPVLQNWLMGTEVPGDTEVARLVRDIRRANNA